MIIEVKTKLECEICDKFLTLLIQDERKYDNTIEKGFIVKNYFINMIEKEHILLMYKEDDKEVGYIFAKKLGNEYLIDGIYVDSVFRKKGIATKLLENVICKIMKLGTFNIYIHVFKDNTEALNLYMNNGFVIEKIEGKKFIMSYKNFKLKLSTFNDLNRLEKYKLDSILNYADDLSQEQILSIKSYVKKQILYYISSYKNIIYDKNIIGSFLVKKIDNGILLDEIYIENKYRNKGIGTMLINNLVWSSIKDVYLWVYKNNDIAVNLYKKIGFVISDETDTRFYMMYKNNRIN